MKANLLSLAKEDGQTQIFFDNNNSKQSSGSPEKVPVANSNGYDQINL